MYTYDVTQFIHIGENIIAIWITWLLNKFSCFNIEFNIWYVYIYVYFFKHDFIKIHYFYSTER